MAPAAQWGTGDSVRLSYMSGYGQVAPNNYGQVAQGEYEIQQGGEYAPGAVDYRSQAIDYAAMLDYSGYTTPGPYGWFPNGGDGSAWGNVGLNEMVAGTKDDLQETGGGGVGGMDVGEVGRGYPNSYYSIETMPMYGTNGFGRRAERDGGGGINTIEQGMNKMNLSANKQSGFETDGAEGDGNIQGGGSSLAGPLSSGAANKSTWANIASQPLDTSPRGIVPLDIPRAPLPLNGIGGKHGGGGGEYGTWGEGRSGDYSGRGGNNAFGGSTGGAHNGWSAMRKRPSSTIVPGTITVMQRPSTAAAAAAAAAANNGNTAGGNTARPGGLPAPTKTNPPPPAVVVAADKPGVYNPHELDDVNARTARFFIIKSYSEDDIHRSIKYAIWCSTEYGNKRLDAAWQERDGKGPVYLLYSVNGSGHFCGIAEMTSGVDYRAQAGIWAQSKWKGQFGVRSVFLSFIIAFIIFKV